MLPEKDRIRLRHMLDATREALGYVQNRSRADLDRESMLFRALVNCIGYFDLNKDVNWATVT